MGTNIGDRKKNLDLSINYLEEYVNIISISSIYKTEPVNMKPETNFFFNMVIRAESLNDPYKMLEITQGIEKKIGRVKKKNTNGVYEDRIIDIDIILAGNEVINVDGLKIPHKEMLNRTFVLVPLNEINPDLIHPVNKKPVSSFLNMIKNKKTISKL